MERGQVQELHYITPIENLPSIRARGILSFNQARELKPASVARADMQAIRDGRPIPGGGTVHDYANIFFHARNPMMFQRKGQHRELAVLRIATDVLELDGAIIATGNAASDYTRFLPSPQGLSALDATMVYARDWTDVNRIQYFRKKTAKLAELLVPKMIPAPLIRGAYVSCKASSTWMGQVASNVDCIIEPDMFFQAGAIQ